MKKTNVMRLLDAAGISYDTFEYLVDESDLSGMHICSQIGLPPEQVFKTLVVKGDKNGPSVICIPVCDEIDLKKAAKITKDKKIELIPVKDLLQLTGYIRGGCSPIGMKKKFPTYISDKAKNFKQITVSAGIRGCQLMVDRESLVNYIQAEYCDITEN